jgi:hypothetical protein
VSALEPQEHQAVTSTRARRAVWPVIVAVVVGFVAIAATYYMIGRGPAGLTAMAVVLALVVLFVIIWSTTGKVTDTPVVGTAPSSQAGLAGSGWPPNGQSPAPTTSTTAIVAFIFAFLFPVIGVVLGYVARKEIRNSGGWKTGSGLALAALWVGWILILVNLAILTILVLVSVSN